MRTVLCVVALVVIAVHCSAAGLLGKKKDKHKHHHSSTSTSTSTSTTTTTTETPTTTDSLDDDDAENVLYLDNMDIIKIHLPLPVTHDLDDVVDYTTAALPTVSQDTPPNPLPTATVPSHLPTAPPFTDGPEEPATTEVPEVTEDPEDEDSEDDEDAAADSTTAASTDVTAEVPEDTGSDAGKVVIPDVATFDAVFANRSRLADDIRVFTFGGVYEIIVNRTQNSVEVVMVRHQTADENVTVPVTEVDEPEEEEQEEEKEEEDRTPERGLQMLVRGPAITGLEEHKKKKKEGGEHDEQGEDQQEKHDEQNDDKQGDGSEDRDAQSDEDDASEIDKSKDNRHSPDQKQDPFDAVFINGSALGGVDVGVVSFNTSGTFKVNLSVAEDFMTVIISQVSQQIQKHGVGMPEHLSGFAWRSGPQRMRSAAPAGGDGASAAPSPLLGVGLVGAAACLLGAVLVWRARRRARVNTFVRRGEDYGTVENAADAFDFYQY